MHLLEYDDATRGPFTCLGRVDSFAVDEVIEIAVPWGLFPEITDTIRQVRFDDYSFVYDNGGIYAADDASNATVAFNNALPVIPEPLTMLTLLPGCGLAAGVLVRRLRRGRRRILDSPGRACDSLPRGIAGEWITITIGRTAD